MGEAQQLRGRFIGLVMTTHRLAAPSPTTALTAEMLETAQWALAVQSRREMESA
jgi:hypothetical protein